MHTLVRFLLLCSLAAVLPGALAVHADEIVADSSQSSVKPKPISYAVIVHKKNPVKGISFSELRAFMKLDRQFWPNKKRCEVFLPGRKTGAYKLVLERIYKMKHKKLQKYWVRKLYAGDIPAKPSYVPSAQAASAQVKRSLGGLSVVRSDRVTKDVRVLTIDGKKPGDAKYALTEKSKKR